MLNCIYVCIHMYVSVKQTHTRIHSIHKIGFEKINLAIRFAPNFFRLQPFHCGIHLQGSWSVCDRFQKAINDCRMESNRCQKTRKEGHSTKAAYSASPFIMSSRGSGVQWRKTSLPNGMPGNKTHDIFALLDSIWHLSDEAVGALDIGSGRSFFWDGEKLKVRNILFGGKNKVANELISYNTWDALTNLQESR